jgi:hypothetical protein
MANGVGQLIEADDFNAIRNKIVNVLGNGAGNFGYGQTIQSSPAVPNTEITAIQWNLLRWDIFNALVHQTGNVPSIVIPNTTNVIKYSPSEPNFQYDTLSNQATTNRFNIGVGQFAVESGVNVSQAVSFSNSAICTITINFSNANQARYFFNSGGKIRFTSSRTGGTNKAQNTSWSSLLLSVGTRSFDGNSPGINFYTLTNANQVLVTQQSSGTYGANQYKISVRSNVANNSTGTATQLIFTVEWIDAYVDPFPSNPPFDVVDGTLTLIVDQIRSVGILQPTNQPFAIVSPTYSASSITTT